MKRILCPVMLILLAVCAIPASVFLGWIATVINCLPLLIWSVFLLFGSKRWETLGDHKAVFFGLLYGILAAVAAAACLVWFLATAFATPYARNPYDSAAGAILLVLASLLLFGVAIFDYCKHGMKPFWLRLVTALFTVAPATLLSLLIMEFFEGILAQYVS